MVPEAAAASQHAPIQPSGLDLKVINVELRTEFIP
jgi:hypothetical protein